MDNYIVINGKKAELTDEQLKKLGIKVEKETPFPKRINNGLYYYITARGIIESETEEGNCIDTGLYNNANYFNDKSFAQQVAWHEELNRRLLKYAYNHKTIVDDWSDPNSNKYFITKNTVDNKFYVSLNNVLKHSCVIYFTSGKAAEQAIEDVVKPFMKEHPEFVW